MRKHLRGKVKYLLWRTCHSPWYLPLVLALSTACTLSMTIPTTAVLIPAVLLRPQRWLWICAAAVLGAAIGSTTIAYGFQAEGWNALQSRFPELVQAQSWQSTMNMVDQYGLWALAAICALPLPQTPALVMCALSQHIPLSGIFVAVLAGKAAKFAALAALAAACPERVMRYLDRH